MSPWVWIAIGGLGAWLVHRMLRPRPQLPPLPLPPQTEDEWLHRPWIFRRRQDHKRRAAEDRFDVDELARRLGMSADGLRTFKPGYQERLIDKRGPYRSGGTSAKRRLHVPDPDTMEIQRRILRRILADLRVHTAATAFEKGSSVARNAQMHARQAVVIKIDLVGFFPSTSSGRVGRYFRRIGWTEEAAAILSRLTTWEGGLPQGAPTSPALSNRVNFPLDIAIDRHCRKLHGTYTRYADDITISFPKDYPRRIRGMIQLVKSVARTYGYRVHQRRKLHVLRRHHRHEVTGLVVNEGARLSRKKRRWLRAVEHRMRTKGKASLTEDQLRGWLAWKAHVDEVRTRMEAEEKERIRKAWFGGSVATDLKMSASALSARMKALGMRPRTGKKKRRRGK